MIFLLVVRGVVLSKNIGLPLKLMASAWPTSCKYPGVAATVIKGLLLFYTRIFILWTFLNLFRHHLYHELDRSVLCLYSYI